MRTTACGSHFKTCHIWFENIESLDMLRSLRNECKGSDCLVIHGNNTKLDRYRPSEQTTLITDLSVPTDCLFSITTKTVRNEINRAEREKVEIEQYPSDFLDKHPDILEKFSSMYQSMYEQKGINGKELPLKELKAYMDNNQLLVTAAKIDGKSVVFHSYVFGEENSRLLHSCSEFRESDNERRNAIGRANKFLHWNDYGTLQTLGVKTYDWGGISSVDNPNGIDRFKLSFGGKPVTYYNITVPISLKYSLYNKISNTTPFRGRSHTQAEHPVHASLQECQRR